MQLDVSKATLTLEQQAQVDQMRREEGENALNPPTLQRVCERIIVDPKWTPGRFVMIAGKRYDTADPIDQPFVEKECIAMLKWLHETRANAQAQRRAMAIRQRIGNRHERRMREAIKP